MKTHDPDPKVTRAEFKQIEDKIVEKVTAHVVAQLTERLERMLETETKAAVQRNVEAFAARHSLPLQ